jgi:glycosyltransferase involved in cell wall biosynthesis
MRPIRAAFVMEQTLGHVTHTQNLRAVVAQQPDVTATWLPVPFDVRGAESLIPLLRSNWSVRASWRARRALTAALAAVSHDAVVFHTQVTSLFSVPVMQRLPAIISLDATPINYDTVGRHYAHRPASDGLLDRQVYRLNRRAFHAAAGLVSWSEWARDSLVRDYGVDAGRIQVIAPGGAPAYFEIGARRLAGETPRRPDDERLRLLFVGGDFERKGGPLLLDCLRGPLGERCELHVVTQAAVRAQQPNVHVHRGLAPNSPELLQLFAAADAFVLPSLADCLAVVLMEATAAALPVVTTNVGALGEAVEPGISGLVVDPGDGAGLQQALSALAQNANRRRGMSQAGYALAQRKFHAERNGRLLLDLVADVSVGRRAARRAA